MSIGLTHSAALLLLPLALLPWIQSGRSAQPYSSLALLPRDPLSRALAIGEKLLASIAIAALIIGVGEPYRPQSTHTRIGQGAEMVILLDRSRSMDQPFYQNEDPASSGVLPAFSGRKFETKGEVARRLLSEFAQRRPDDMFGLVVFSTKAIPVLPLTRNPAIIQAAIQAGNVGRGLAETNVGAGLKQAIRFFEGRPFTGSRIVMLISDGAATLDLGSRAEIQQLARQQRVALYWLYIRTRNSPSIFDPIQQQMDADELYPQWPLHRFFRDLGTPYRAYAAEDPEALERAIADVSRLQNLPIHYAEVIPRQPMHPAFYATAVGAMLVLFGLRILEREVGE